MISNFFSKTKPANQAVVIGILVLGYWLVWATVNGIAGLKANLLWILLGNIGLVVSVLGISQIVKFNKLTGTNSFAIFFFVLMLFCFNAVFLNIKEIYAALFLMFSLGRIITLLSQKNKKEKVFEAALWLFMAVIIDPWTILFVVPLYLAITQFWNNEMRLWFMPFAAFFALTFIVFAIAINTESVTALLEHFALQFGFGLFQAVPYGLILYLLFCVLLALFVFGKIGYRRQGKTLRLRVVLGYLFTAILLIALPVEGFAPKVLYTFFPMSIVLTNYTNSIRKPRFKELFLWTVVILGIVFLCLTLLQ